MPRTMSFRFRLLGSSSSGNCGVLETDQTRILIDAGFTGKQIERRLLTDGLTPRDLEAVFLTHEHGDHTAGLRGLARHEHLEFFATYGTAKTSQAPLKRDLRWRTFEAETTFRFRDLEVTVLRIPHDACDPVGFIFRTGGDDLFKPTRSVAWLTDLGYIPASLSERIRDVDLLILEANHDLAMLDNDTIRPFSVKQRIRGRHGHLSNEATCEFLDGVAAPRWREVVFAHLSRDCNSLEKAAATLGHGQRAYRTTLADPLAEGGSWIDLNGW